MVSEENSFAYYTITQRLPAIVKRVIADNDFSSSSIIKNLELLAKEILDGFIRPLKNEAELDITAWTSYIEPFQGNRWFDVPFYFAEAYFYRRILEATNYFQTGEQYNLDPFELQKCQSLENSMDSIRSISGRVNTLRQLSEEKNTKTSLTTLLKLALSGNRVDLSLFQLKERDNNPNQLGQECNLDDILVDDSPIIADLIETFQGVRIDFIIDNAGFELFCDLCLVDYLLATQAAEKIYLHLKSHPIFVSDAMSKDVHHTLEILETDKDSQVNALNYRLKNISVMGVCY